MTGQGGTDALLARIRAGSPYLSDSLDMFPDIVGLYETRTPEDVFDLLRADVPQEVGELSDEMAALRRFKRRAHLLIALADVSGVWGWETVTEYLSRIADMACQRLLIAAGRAAGIEAEEDNPVPGFFLLAVGKYGARELNYSSDIDFNVFYDPDVIRLPRPERAERTMIKLVQTLIKGLEQVTVDGYIFRTDLRLRPDPRSNAVAVSTLTAERYYEKLGQNWERAAMIKARVCAGDRDVGEGFIRNVLRPFIWRRNLDYAAIDDILAIKSQIHTLKTGHEIKPAGHHLKLGLGGIREIEFYAQVQQLILGGRHPELRIPRTVDALAALSQGGFSASEDTEALTRHYADLRTWEHRAQMVTDAQTHHVPEEEEARTRFALFCGFENVAAFDEAVLTVLSDVHERYRGLFPEAESLSSLSGSLVFTGVEPGPETLATLERLGYGRGPEVWRHMADWLGGRIPATRSERAREYLTRLAPHIIDVCAETGVPDQAFFTFGRFLSGLRGGVSVLSMFAGEPERVRYLISLMMRSPHVADMLTDRPRILDAMADPDFLTVTSEALGRTYQTDVAAASDFEEALNIIRQCVREDRFRIVAGLLTGRLALDDSGPLFTHMADKAVQAVLPFAIREATKNRSDMTGEIAVLGLGKAGGREMSLVSDLDIMVIYRPGDTETDAQYTYSKITQRLISALSSVTAEGGLFEVDMALRPSGRKGPVAVSMEAFTSYYQEHAWTWEFMAMTRARVMAASSPGFEQTVSDIVKDILQTDRPDLDRVPDMADMLTRTKAAKHPHHDWDVKNADGGLRDIEYILQSLLLADVGVAVQSDDYQSGQAMIEHAARSLSVQDYKAVKSAFLFYSRLRASMSVIAGHVGASGLSETEKSNIADVVGAQQSHVLHEELLRHTQAIIPIRKRIIGV